VKLLVVNQIAIISWYRGMIAVLRRRRTRNVIASILVPPAMFFGIGLLQKASANYISPWDMFISLGVGFTFLLREFKFLAVLFCWAYFIPMFWFTLYAMIYLAAIVLRSPP
jgi:hypothetical protein